MRMNQLNKDELTTRLKGAGLLLFILLFILYCNKVKGQEIISIEKDTANQFKMMADTKYGVTETYGNYSVYFEINTQEETEYRFTFTSSFTTTKDTTEVAYVTLKQVRDSFTLDTVYHFNFPYVDTFFGYLIQKHKPYRVEYYDLFWRPIDEEDILHIKKRKKK